MNGVPFAAGAVFSGNNPGVRLLIKGELFSDTLRFQAVFFSHSGFEFV
jgi:hypothetical protein